MISTAVTIGAGIALTVGVLVLARRSLALAFAAVLVALLLASSSIGAVKEVFLDLRWAALAGLALSLLWPLPRPRELTRLQLVVLGVVPLAAASALWSIDPRLTLLRTVSFALLLWALVAAVSRPHRVTGDAGRFVVTLACVSALLWVASLVLWLVRPDTAIYVGDLRGILENQNGLGLFLGLTFAFVLAALELRRMDWRWLILVGLGYVGVIALSESRSGFVALLVGVAVYELSRRAYRRLAVELAACACAFALAVWALPSLSTPSAADPAPAGSVPSATPAPAPEAPPPAVSRSSALLGARAPDQSRVSSLLGARDEAWAATVDLIAERPLVGYGFGTGDRVFEVRPEQARFVYFQGANPNNGYLQALLELGLLGLVPIGLLAVPVTATIAAARRRRLPPARAAFFAVLVAGLVAGLFESLFTAAGAPWAALVWLSAVGLCAPGRSVQEDEVVQEPPRNPDLAGEYSWPDEQEAKARPSSIRPARRPPRPPRRARSWGVVAAALAVLAVAAVAGLAIYVVAREAETAPGTTGPLPAMAEERRTAELFASRILAVECVAASRCRVAKVDRVSPSLWRVVIHGQEPSCYALDLRRFVVRGGRTLEGVAEVPCTSFPLLRSNTLTIAAEFPPPDRTPPTDALTSYRIDVARALADRLEIPAMRWVREDPADPAAAAARADIVLHPIPLAETARPDVDTSFPYLTIDLGVFVLEESKDEFGSRGDVASKRIAVGDGAALQYVRAVMPDAEFESFPTPDLAAAAVRNGDADVMLAHVQTALGIAAQFPDEIAVPGRLVGVEGLVLLLETANGLLDPINGAIRDLRTNGTLAKLQERWFPGVRQVPVLP
ncbi:MAG TPA: transporter substrate-binding domain-containing protein [Gaiellaceae bacterium]|nr:transporter substrate-binding domain-containing protein [Gaiellaceae bacterium]